MNRALRRGHLWRISALSILVPLGFGAALFGRVKFPGGEPRAQEELESLDDLTGDVGPVVSIDVDGVAVSLELFENRNEGSLELRVRSTAVLLQPDVLVYWDSRDGSGKEELPPDAFLLGSFSGSEKQVLKLPDQALDGGGRVILYSLGHAEVLGTAALARLGGKKD